MKNVYPPENPPDKTGNEPAPLLMIAVAVVLARPIVFVLVGVYVVLWLFFDHKIGGYWNFLLIRARWQDLPHSLIRSTHSPFN